MRAVYIGILTPGSTSRMRAETLRKLTPSYEWEWIDTDPPMNESARVWKTLAFRMGTGKAVTRINRLVTSRMGATRCDLVWIDKGVFLHRSTIQSVRRLTRKLVHFTPDAAFHMNGSRHFESSLGDFDLAITTKSFELSEYFRRIGAERTLLTTQAYDTEVHYPRSGDEYRRREAVFVGLAEPDREKCVAMLLDGGVPVRLAGIGWTKFLRRWGANSLLTFESEAVFGAEYARLLSESWIGLGLLSQRFPELHTTRTFEIPACGAVLATPRTIETNAFFGENEALFFDDYADLATKVSALLSSENTVRLSEMAAAGRRRVQSDCRDYSSILASILDDSRLKRL